jgi:hypothetical protein
MFSAQSAFSELSEDSHINQRETTSTPLASLAVSTTNHKQAELRKQRLVTVVHIEDKRRLSLAVCLVLVITRLIEPIIVIKRIMSK